MNDIEKQRLLEKARPGVKVLWHWLLPTIIWFVVTVIFVLIKIVAETFVSWLTLILLSILIGVVGIGIGMGMYWWKRNQLNKVSEQLPFVNIDEFEEMVIKRMMRDKNNPVNLKKYTGNGAFSTIKTVGGGTEVFISKFFDANPAIADTYYCLARRDDLGSIYPYKIRVEPDPEEEDLLIDKFCERLAKSPSSHIETRIERRSALTGVEELETVRTPVEVRTGKESDEEKKEDIEG